MGVETPTEHLGKLKMTWFSERTLRRRRCPNPHGAEQMSRAQPEAGSQAYFAQPIRPDRPLIWTCNGKVDKMNSWRYLMKRVCAHWRSRGRRDFTIRPLALCKKA